MKHSSNRELFEYWNKRRGRRSAPERGEIEPGAIRHVLADTFILVGAQQRYCRVAVKKRFAARAGCVKL